MGVVQHGLRPTPPPNTPAPLADVMARCWHKNPAARPSFSELVPVLEALHKSLTSAQEAASSGGGGGGASGSGVTGQTPPRGGFFSKLRGAHHKGAT